MEQPFLWEQSHLSPSQVTSPQNCRSPGCDLPRTASFLGVGTFPPPSQEPVIFPTHSEKPTPPLTPPNLEVHSPCVWACFPSPVRDQPLQRTALPLPRNPLGTSPLPAPSNFTVDSPPSPRTTSVPSPSGSVPGASAPFRPLFNDFGPPSMGYVQAMKPPGSQGSQSTYTDLLSVIEEMGKEIRPTYAGSKSAMERLKRGIIHARALVRECLAETERNART
uniref:Cyclin dependent kinase 2 associated protein 2 n=2 Tax=Testudinidae TaxID=8487 RepID=A0A8C0G338_CHEAB